MEIIRVLDLPASGKAFTYISIGNLSGDNQKPSIYLEIAVDIYV